MLLNLTKKLCPLISLALLFGCGKKIGEPETSDSNQTQFPQTPEDLPGILTVQLNESKSSVKVYEMPRNGWFQLPKKLVVQKGFATNRRVKIYYNYLSEDDYEFHCYYGSSGSTSQLDFDRCESSDNIPTIESTEELENVEFPMDKGTELRMQLLNPVSSGLVIDSVYLVDWK